MEDFEALLIRPRPAGSKAGRNERLKVLATLLNNISAASLLSGLLQPGLALLNSTRTIALRDAAAALVFGLLAAILHAAAQAVASRLED